MITCLFFLSSTNKIKVKEYTIKRHYPQQHWKGNRNKEYSTDYGRWKVNEVITNLIEQRKVKSKHLRGEFQ